MDEKVVSFLRKVYREHYFKRHDLVEIPSAMASREFGYIPFGGGMIRHLSFKNPGRALRGPGETGSILRVLLQRHLRKARRFRWTRRDGREPTSIFDIDADSIPTSCKTRHTWWFCSNCHKGGMGTKPARCPGCRQETAEQIHWSCRECLNATKEHVKRLVDYLQDDFGIDREDIQLYFSGNRGYHAQVHDERFQMADPQMRSEIAKYVKGTGFSLKAQDRVPGHVELGWSRRADLFQSTTEGGSRLKKNQKLANQIVAANAALIDESVTTDIHRVFRMPGTLHGNSGMLKMRIESLEEFDPLSQPVILSGETVTVRIYYSPEFYLKGAWFGPYNSSIVQIPIYAAVFLLARGLGAMSN